jgi:glucosylceramidase
MTVEMQYDMFRVSCPSLSRWFLCACALLLAAELSRAQSVNVWLTTDDQSQKLQAQAPLSFSTASGGANPIVVDETKVYQQVEGFGASFTDTTGYALNELATTPGRNAAMTNLFSRNEGGIGLGFVRNPMGASDLSRSIYSYDDLPAGQTDTNLNSFSIAHDEADIIPLLKQALLLNPQLKIMANPWSPPGWMKDSGSMVGGSLLPGMYPAFAQYYVKYLQAYAADGVPVNYISLQNEPLYVPADYPGMAMNAATQTIVLRDYVLPALTANHLTNTTVLVYDHNWDRPDYPTTVFSDATIRASPQVTGTAWHGYGGTPGVMLSLEASYPARGNYLTEHSGGTWVGDQVRADFEEIIHVMRSWGKSYVKWNLASDENDGPHSGGCSTCTPLVYVNSSTHAVSYGIEFYTLGHFSKFVLPGASRIYSGNGAGVISAAFLNPDGSKALVAYNDTGSSATFQVQWGTQSFPYTLASYAGATFTWTGTQNGGYAVDAAKPIQASSFNLISGLQTEPSSDVLGGYDLGFSSGGDYAGYQNVNLAAGFSNVTARVASAGAGGTLEFHLDSATGPMLGSLAVPITGGWQTWQNVTSPAFGGSGLHTLFAVFQGSSGIGNLNSLQMSGAIPPLPAPWSSSDIGAVGIAGGAIATSAAFTANGSGNDIWNTADAFHFVDQPVAGNSEIRARVINLQNTDPWAKAGVMIRDSIAAGAANVAVVLAPSNGVSFQIRSIAGGVTTSTVAGGGTVIAPRWVRLVRAGNSFSGFYSSDGSAWTQVGTTTLVPMSSDALMGLAVSSHNNASNCVASWDNVSVNQSPVAAAIANQTMVAGRTLVVTNLATDADVPSQTLSYGSPNAPTGSTLNASSGVFTWRPAIAQSPSTQTVSLVTSDSGLPSMSVTQSFTVTVNRPAIPQLSNPAVSNGFFAAWIAGDTGPDYLLQVSSNLSTWSTVATSTPNTTPFYWAITNSPQSPAQFFRVTLGP